VLLSVLCAFTAIACSETKYAGVKVAKTQPEYKWVFVAWTEDDSKMTAIRKSVEKSMTMTKLTSTFEDLRSAAKRSGKPVDLYRLGYSAAWMSLLDDSAADWAGKADSFLAQYECPKSYEYSRMRFILALRSGLPHNFYGHVADRLLERDSKDWNVMFLSVKVLIGKWTDQRKLGLERVGKLLLEYPTNETVSNLAGDWYRSMAGSLRAPAYAEKAIGFFKETIRLSEKHGTSCELAKKKLKQSELDLSDEAFWDPKAWKAYKAKKSDR